MFNLEIEFSGLCMYLHDEDAKAVGIVLPDARTNAEPRHDDGSTGVAHVAYLRFDLADTDLTVPRGQSDDPRFEVVYRFDEEELDLGLYDDEGHAASSVKMPVIKEFAPTLRPVPGLFAYENWPSGMVMRMVLRGGFLTSVPFPDRWKFSTLLDLDGDPPYRDTFAGYSTWRRPVSDRDELVLTFKDFRGNAKRTITLRPKGPDNTIRLKIANLCADNPMEWPQLRERFLPNGRFLDEDFKWFYRLLQPTTGRLESMVDATRPLPVPELEDTKTRAAGEEPPDCTGAQTTYSIGRG